MKLILTVNGGKLQVPAVHDSPSSQAFPHVPQFAVFVFVFTQTPEQQVSPAAQAFPHVPQLDSSVCTALQTPEQHS